MSTTKYDYVDWKFSADTITKWSRDVTSKRVPDTILFTEKPLKSYIDTPENAKFDQVKQIEEQNQQIMINNESLVKNAKTLKQILIDKNIEQPIK